jgi:hypothetical protein
MVKMRYPGVVDAHNAFGRLRAFRNALIELKCQCRPFGSDYLVLDMVQKALDTAAYHFTREPDFYALRPEQSVGGRAQPPVDPA